MCCIVLKIHVQLGQKSLPRGSPRATLTLLVMEAFCHLFESYGDMAEARKAKQGYLPHLKVPALSGSKLHNSANDADSRSPPETEL